MPASTLCCRQDSMLATSCQEMCPSKSSLVRRDPQLGASCTCPLLWAARSAIYWMRPGRVTPHALDKFTRAELMVEARFHQVGQLHTLLPSMFWPTAISMDLPRAPLAHCWTWGFYAMQFCVLSMAVGGAGRAPSRDIRCCF